MKYNKLCLLIILITSMYKGYSGSIDYLIDTTGYHNLRPNQQQLVDSLLLAYHQPDASFLDQSNAINKLARSFSLGEISYRYNEWLHDALKDYSESSNSKNHDEIRKLQGNCQNRFGIKYYLSGDIDKALLYFRKALEIRKELNNLGDLCKSFNNVGICEKLKGNTLEAMRIYSNALQICEDLEDDVALSGLYNSYSNVLITTGDYEKGIEYLFKSLKLVEDKNDKEGMGIAYENIGAALSKQQEFEEALKYRYKARDTYKEIGNNSREAHILTSIGSQYIQDKDYKNALKYLLEAEDICETLDEPQTSAYVYGNLGKTYQGMNRYELAKDYFQKSVSISEDMGIQYDDVSAVYSQYGELELNAGNIDRSSELLEKGLEIAQNANDLERIIATTGSMLKLALYNDDYKTAYELSEMRKKVLDSLVNKDHYKMTIKNQFKYEYEKEILEKDLKINYETKRASLLRRMLIIAGIIAVILAVMSYFLFYMNNRLRKQKEEISAKQQLVDNALKDLKEKNQIIESQKESLQEANDNLNNELKSSLLLLSSYSETKNELIKLIESDENLTQGSKRTLLRVLDTKFNEEIIENINFKFIQTNKHFYKNLSSEYPKLTKNNIMLCMLLKLQLGTKEIASILFKSPETIKVAKSRLRKKLQIEDSSTNLHAFLMRFD